MAHDLPGRHWENDKPYLLAQDWALFKYMDHPPAARHRKEMQDEGKYLGDIELWVWATNRRTLQLDREGPL